MNIDKNNITTDSPKDGQTNKEANFTTTIRQKLWDNKKILAGLTVFVAVAAMAVAVHSSDEDTIEQVLKERVRFVNLQDDEAGTMPLPKQAKLIANYPGRQNAVYYRYNERIFVYDKTRKSYTEIPFGYGYESIKDIYLSPAKSRIFVVLDMGSHADNYVCNGQQLWVINTLNRQSRKLIEGFKAEKRKGCIVMSKADYCLNSKAPIEKRRWKCRNHYFSFTGKVIWSMDDYVVNEKDYLR